MGQTAKKQQVRAGARGAVVPASFCAAPMGVLLAGLALLVLLALAPVAPAWAADYRCAQVDLTAEVETNGSITVVDQRIFEFMDEGEGGQETASDADGESDRAASADEASREQLPDTSVAAPRQTLKWLYNGFGEDAELTIKRVRMAQVDAEGNVTGSWQKLKPVTFLLSWREGGGPQKDAWSYDKYRSTLYAFTSASSERVVFEVTYRVRHAVVAYDDAADFSWEFAPRDYPVNLHNVTAEVVLPVPADTRVVPGDNVRAWGHGPAEGTVDVEQDGSVTFFDPEVTSEAYALGRVMFPVGWLTNLPDDERLAHQGTLQYEPTTRYEESWVDRETNQAITRNGLAAALMALCAVMLVAGMGAYLRWGRQKPPAFTDNETNVVPAPWLAPAVMGRLWRWNHISSDDLTATVVDMVRRGVVTVEPGACPGSESGGADGAGESGESDGAGESALRFTPWRPDSDDLTAAQQQALRTREVDSSTESVFEEGINQAGEDSPGRAAMDAATVRLLTFVSQGNPRLSLEQVASFAQANPGAFLRAVDAWQQTLTATVAPQGFFDQRSRRAQGLVLGGAAVLAVLAVAAFLVVGWVPAAFALVSAGALGVLANYTMRRSPEGNEITAHAKALRNWMRDGGVQAQRAEEGDRCAEAGDGRAEEAAGCEEEALVPYAVLFGVLDALPPTSLGSFACGLSQALEEALRAASRRAEVAGSTGEAPADKEVEPHWRPFWRRRATAEETIDDDF